MMLWSGGLNLLHPVLIMFRSTKHFAGNSNNSSNSSIISMSTRDLPPKKHDTHFVLATHGYVRIRHTIPCLTFLTGKSELDTSRKSWGFFSGERGSCAVGRPEPKMLHVNTSSDLLCKFYDEDITAVYHVHMQAKGRREGKGEIFGEHYN